MGQLSLLRPIGELASWQASQKDRLQLWRHHRQALHHLQGKDRKAHAGCLVAQASDPCKQAVFLSDALSALQTQENNNLPKLSIV